MRSILLLCGVHSVISTGFGVRPLSLKLNDGRSMPGIAVGTWLGYNRQGQLVVPEGREVENAVKWAIEAGYRHVDTAHMYMVEEQVGRAIAAKIQDGTIKREDIFVTSKLWNDRHKRDQVIPALKESLNKLGLQYLDLYLIHWPVATYSDGKLDTATDYVDTWKGMQEAKLLNLTRSIGISNFNMNQTERIIGLHGDKPAVLQVEINPNLQQPTLLEYAKKHGLTVMGYRPFGSLFPSKADPAAPPPRVGDHELVSMAAKYNKTVPQIVLRYLVELGVVPIPKSQNKLRIQENIDIFDFELCENDKIILKAYDNNYRTMTPTRFRESPHYPFADENVKN